MNEELLEIKAEFMGFHTGRYPGAFPPRVERQIKMVIGSPCLHLFSGTSRIGDVRIDLERPEATVNQDVFEFIRTDKREWPWVLADPPYDVARPERTLKGYASTKSFLGDVYRQKAISDYLKGHADNVLWFDFVSPCPPGFYREKLWTYLPGGWKKVRVLTWLKREGERLA